MLREALLDGRHHSLHALVKGLRVILGKLPVDGELFLNRLFYLRFILGFTNVVKACADAFVSDSSEGLQANNRLLHQALKSRRIFSHTCLVHLFELGIGIVCQLLCEILQVDGERHLFIA